MFHLWGENREASKNEEQSGVQGVLLKQSGGPRYGETGNPGSETCKYSGTKQVDSRRFY